MPAFSWKTFFLLAAMVGFSAARREPRIHVKKEYVQGKPAFLTIEAVVLSPN